MKTRKFTAGLLALAMLLSLVAIPGAAFAASTYEVAQKAAGSNGNVALVSVNVPGAVAGQTSKVVLTLGNNVEFKDITHVGTDAAITSTVYTGGVKSPNAEVVVTAADTGDLTFALRLELDTAAADVGDTTMTIANMSGFMSGGSVVVHTKSAPGARGNVNVSVLETQNITTSGTGLKDIKVRLATTNGTAIQAGDELTFDLPEGFAFVNAPVISNVSAGTMGGSFTPNTARDSATYVVGANQAKSIHDVAFTVKANARDAAFGDVKLTVKSNKMNLSTKSLVVGKYQDFGIKVFVEKATEIKGGKKNQELGTITIEETAPGSLIKDRSIYLVLPQGVKVAQLPAAIDLQPVKGGGGILSVNDVIKEGNGKNNEDRVVELLVTNTSTTEAKYEIRKLAVHTAVGFEGPVNIEVRSNTGLEGDVHAADVIAPVKVTVEKSDVKIGIQDQPMGKITIEENYDGALVKGEKLNITSEDGNLRFNNKGALVYDKDNMDVTIVDPKASGTEILLDVKKSSADAATIVLEGALATLNRILPEGDVMVNIGNLASGTDSAGDEVNAVSETLDFFEHELNRIAKVAIATVTTPAPDNTTGVVGSVEFVIDAKTYTVNGVEKTMDVAPYIQDGRTMLPVRFVAEALGVSEDNIIWDATAKTVTIMKGDRIAQMTIGSKAMVVNGVTVQMDVAAAIKDGRTVLPLRFAAQALGANIEWNDATRTVTIN